MKEKLTEGDWALMEVLHDPVAFCEVFVPKSIESPRRFMKEEGIKIREFQKAFFSYDVLLVDDPDLSVRENYRRREVAGTVNVIGGRSAGKCPSVNDLCLLGDGTQVKFGELVGKTFEICSFNQKTWKLEKAWAHAVDNGYKDCLEITTNTGRTITVTKNHPLFIAGQWVLAENVSVGDWIALARRFPHATKIDVPDYHAKLLGYLLGDGGCTTSTINFTKDNKQIIGELRGIARSFSCELSNTGGRISYRFRRIKGYEGKNKVTQFVSDYKINTLSKNKVIPEDVFVWSKKNIALMLNRLFACDGYIDKRNGSIEYCSASHKMIKQVQDLLLKFGIHSGIYYKNAKCGDKYFDAWRLFITLDFDLFLNKIGTFGKDKGYRKKKTFSSGDSIPKVLYKDSFLDGIRGRGIIKKYCLRKVKIYNASRRKWQLFGSLTNDEDVLRIANSDIYWDKIKSIKEVSNVSTVAVTVLGNETLVQNGVISHNSLCTTSFNSIIDLISNSHLSTLIMAKDTTHLTRGISRTLNYIEHHPFFKFWLLKGKTNSVNRKDPITVTLRNGHMTYAEIEGMRNPGDNFTGYHVHKKIFEEAQMITKEAYDKQLNSKHETFCVEIMSGVPDGRRLTPFSLMYNKKGMGTAKVVIPAMVNPFWSKKQKEELLLFFGGEQSQGYQTNVLAHEGDSAVGAWDMSQYDDCVDKSRRSKVYYINKENFIHYADFLFLSRNERAKKIYLSADIGLSSAPTEVIVWGLEKKGWIKYYRVCFQGLTFVQQAEVFDYLMMQFRAEKLGLDATDGTGTAIFVDLTTNPKYKGKGYNHRVDGVKFNENIIIGHKINDETGEPILDKSGKKIDRVAEIKVWSTLCMRGMFAEQEVNLPYDEEECSQFAKQIAIRTENGKIKYSKGFDHIIDAFRVFAILVFKAKQKEEKAVEMTPSMFMAWA